MGFNILQAISNVAKYQITDLSEYNTTYEIGINSEGERLEYYIKDCIAETLHIKGKAEKEAEYARVFAWLGNQNNPPDMIIRGGDAFEIKKTKTANPTIQLNSSPPKDILHSDDSRLVSACKECDGGDWDVKDIYYVMGQVKSNQLSHIFFVQGRCYAAKSEVYSKISDTITDSIISADMEFNQTNELGRVNRVDPMGITDLRIRGLWQIQHPIKVFNQYYRPVKGKLSMAAVMLESKYDSYPIEDRKKIEDSASLSLDRISIIDPNNPANRLDAVLLSNSLRLS